MKKITYFKFLLLALVMLVGSGNAFAAVGDVVYTLPGGTGQPFGSSNAYALKTGTYSSVDWTATLGSCQSANEFWLGSNSKGKANLTLGAVYAKVGTPCSIGATDTYTTALIAGSDFANVGKVTLANTSIGGSATTPTVWVVYSTDAGTTYSLAAASQTAASAGTLTFEFTTIPSARYAVVVKGTNDFTYRVPVLTFYEGATGTPKTVTPTFSPAAGTYYVAQSVTLSSETSGATIYYTTDGATPDNTKTAYSTPIAVNSTTTIKAIAYATGFDPSAVATAAYTIDLTPIITVTQSTIPAMTAEVGSTDAETITVSAANLTGDISLAVTGDDAALFTLSTASLTQSEGAVTDQSVTITYTPVAAGSHTATLTLTSPGAANVVLSLSGTATWAPLTTPVATAASGIGNNGFTANWDAVPGATEYVLSVYTKEESVVNATDLFISEYIEGSSNNKAIEIFNGTGTSVDLSNYELHQYNNGATSAGSYTLALSGILANNDVFVIINNQSTIFTNEDLNTNSSVMGFNGDDAIVLYNKLESSNVDIFGRIGNDPGAAWTGDGGYSTSDKTLRRKSSVTAGITVSPTGTGAGAFTTLTTEWDLYNTDDVSGLGTHTFAGTTQALIQVTGSPFEGIGTNSKAITGLAKSTIYYYTVVASNDNVTSEVSNEMQAATGPTVGTDFVSSLNNDITAHNGNIRFSAKAGESVQVYNAVGQQLISRTAVDGLNTIPVNTRGILMVKVGNRIAKVIL